ncbi:MAG: sulfurtransferase [Gammaproteobacteria bacterium]|nr:sulfurtransferase [Gammaproteobacteria bacterium]
MAALIQPSTLAALLREATPPLLFDASWHLPSAQRDARAEFQAKHIEGARFFNLDAFCDTSHPLPNMLSKDSNHLAQQLGLQGIERQHRIVFYDNSTLRTSCRAYWILRIAGHPIENIAILNGGLTTWEKYSGKTTADILPIIPTTYQPNYQPQLICDLNDVKSALKQNSAQIIDLRHPVRFAGGPELRPGLRQGHIPHSFSFPYLSFTSLHDGLFFSIEKIRKNLTEIGVNLNAPIISTCGSGMSAPILNFFLSLMKHPAHRLYDGSWTEWGAATCYPGETDLSERPVATCLE